MADVLIGAAGQDWFFATLGGPGLDVVADLHPDDELVDVTA
jgi:hypothetical protein